MSTIAAHDGRDAEAPPRSATYAKVGAPWVVDARTRGRQLQPEIARLNGGFVTIWTDDVLQDCEIGGSDVRAKRFDLSGAPQGGAFLVNSETIGHQLDPKIAGLTEGGFVAVWRDFSGRGGDDCSGAIKAKIFDAAGRVVCNEMLVNVETNDTQLNASVAATRDGGFAIVWQCEQGAGGERAPSSVKVRMFSPNGVPSEKELVLSDDPEGHCERPVVAGLTDGAFVAVWRTDASAARVSKNNATIKAKILASNGAVLRNAFEVGSVIARAAPVVAPLEDGKFVIAWFDRPDPQNRAGPVYLKVRCFDTAGRPVGDHSIEAEVAGAQGLAIAAFEDGGFVLVWAETGGERQSTIRAAAYAGDGAAADSVIMIAEASDMVLRNPAVVALGGGSVVVAWEEAADEAGGEVSVRAQLLASR